MFSYFYKNPPQGLGTLSTRQVQSLQTRPKRTAILHDIQLPSATLHLIAAFFTRVNAGTNQTHKYPDERSEETNNLLRRWTPCYIELAAPLMGKRLFRVTSYNSPWRACHGSGVS